MSTHQPQPPTETEPTPDRTTPHTHRPRSSAATPRTATDRAPRTFSHRNATRLENLIDEWNAAFANETPDEAA
ncbi:hypothetical protein [Natrinema salaciae]|uniref:Uncharacterized protein n=1 Tax=Natrinema salaciae TaxID=1186196 RepID=A0A1H9MW42_9EURY|nr:hypothetical protein [Natrinema salaciae]SER27791.1 hypothetical protein SAMN04489841_3518 [Natrinema salaciae]